MSGVTAATVAGYAAVAASLIGAGMSAVGSYQSAQAQQRQAETQSKLAARNAQIANQNAELAEEEGREAKKIGYENAVKKRQEVAGIVGAQRAAQAASGIQVDAGAALDLNLDTVEKGELDALALKEQGLQQDYMKRVDAWNLKEQGTGQQIQSQMYSQMGQSYSPWLSAGSTLLSGVAQAGSNYYSMTKGASPKTLTREQQGLDPYGWQH